MIVFILFLNAMPLLLSINYGQVVNWPVSQVFLISWTRGLKFVVSPQTLC